MQRKRLLQKNKPNISKINFKRGAPDIIIGRTEKELGYSIRCTGVLKIAQL